MSGFLLDTNTVSELVSVKPNQRVVDWLEASDENQLYLSVMTLGEIRHGVAALPQSKKRTALEAWLAVLVIATAALSAYDPARRAARINPVLALRSE